MEDEIRGACSIHGRKEKFSFGWGNLKGREKERERPLGRLSCRWQDTIKIVVGEIECDYVD
jgi:hypothetical protein